jgi:hypothetical protein
MEPGNAAGSDGKRVRTGWTVYTGLLTAAIIAGESMNVVAARGIDNRAFLTWILTAFLLVAAWGYALGRPIGHARYWQRVFWVVVAAGAISLVPALLAGPAARVVVALTVPCVVPAFVAAYRYAYRSPELWRVEEESS